MAILPQACVLEFPLLHNNVPIAHVEAGLRTKTVKSPFPEELNRRVISILSDLNFAPTRFAKDNLITEGVSRKKVFVTGNTVVDSVLISSKRLKRTKACQKLMKLSKNKISNTKRMIWSLDTGEKILADHSKIFFQLLSPLLIN